ncbi:MAG: O-antigen ligase family protein [Legionellaceae bacterium]|nr:O-antigen ligase family protein [Legionellaceae bacterium]
MVLNKFTPTNLLNKWNKMYSGHVRNLSFWSSIFIVLTAFMIPISSTLRSIGVSVSVILLLIDPSRLAELKQLCKHPAVKTAFVFFIFSALACFWSPANLHEQWTVLEKYSKLIYLPFFMLVFRDPRTRSIALHAFLLAMLITCILLLLKAVGWVHYGGDDPGQMFRNHIMTGYMMVFAAYLAAYFSYHASCLRHRIAYGCLAFILSYQILFTGTGRMAYIAYALLAALWIFQIFSWRKALILAGLGGVLLAGAYAMNPTIQFLAHQVKDDWTLYHQHKRDTSLGFRLQFHTYAYDLFKRHPWFGNGTGSFSHKFQVENPVPEWSATHPKLLEPHSQYWMVASELGITGLFLFALLLGNLCVSCWRTPETRALGSAVLLPMLLGNFTDSLLLYSGTGYFFLLFAALALASHPKISSSLCNQADASDAAKLPPLQAKAGAIQT